MSVARINELLREAEKALEEAEKVADESGEDFHWDGPTYGMGGYYRAAYQGSDEDWESSDEGWQASSQSC